MSNAEFLPALLDVRFIAGDERLFQRLEGWFQGLGADNRRRLLDALLQLVDERHAPFNDTVYQLEPDIKSAPGVSGTSWRPAHPPRNPAAPISNSSAPRGSCRRPRTSFSASARFCTSRPAATSTC